MNPTKNHYQFVCMSTQGILVYITSIDNENLFIPQRIPEWRMGIALANGESMSYYNTKISSVDHNQSRVGRVSRFLHVKDLLCIFRKRVGTFQQLKKHWSFLPKSPYFPLCFKQSLLDLTHHSLISASILDIGNIFSS